ncbi:MAG: EamA family transporter [Solibacillus sp.]
MMEWLLYHTTMTAEFILAVRLFIAWSSILLLLKIKKTPILPVWKEKYWATQLVIFSLLGMVGLQYSFVKTIEESNAIVATLLQFLAPIFIIIYMAMIHKKLPPKSQFIGI